MFPNGRVQSYLNVMIQYLHTFFQMRDTLLTSRVIKIQYLYPCFRRKIRCLPERKIQAVVSDYVLSGRVPQLWLRPRQNLLHTCFRMARFEVTWMEWFSMCIHVSRWRLRCLPEWKYLIFVPMFPKENTLFTWIKNPGSICKHVWMGWLFLGFCVFCVCMGVMLHFGFTDCGRGKPPTILNRLEWKDLFWADFFGFAFFFNIFTLQKQKGAKVQIVGFKKCLFGFIFWFFLEKCTFAPLPLAKGKCCPFCFQKNGLHPSALLRMLRACLWHPSLSTEIHNTSTPDTASNQRFASQIDMFLSSHVFLCSHFLYLVSCETWCRRRAQVCNWKHRSVNPSAHIPQLGVVDRRRSLAENTLLPICLCIGQNWASSTVTRLLLRRFVGQICKQGIQIQFWEINHSSTLDSARFGKIGWATQLLHDKRGKALYPVLFAGISHRSTLTSILQTRDPNLIWEINITSTLDTAIFCKNGGRNQLWHM